MAPGIEFALLIAQFILFLTAVEFWIKYGKYTIVEHGIKIWEMMF